MVLMLFWVYFMQDVVVEAVVLFAVVSVACKGMDKLK